MECVLQQVSVALTRVYFDHIELRIECFDPEFYDIETKIINALLSICHCYGYTNSIQ